MYTKKVIREFIEKMPKETKLTKEWEKFIKQIDESHNLLIEHGKEEYECTNCGKYSYGKLLNSRNYAYHDICRFCGKKFEIRRSNLKNYFFLYNLAMVDNMNNKLVIRYYEVYRRYNHVNRRFNDSIVEFARYVPELNVILLNDRCPRGQNIYHYEKIEKWRVFEGKYYGNNGYKSIYLKDIDEKKNGTAYQYIPLGDVINHLEDINYDSLFRIFNLAKYNSFELLVKSGLYNLAFECPEKFNIHGSFEKRFGVKKEFYKFMQKHDISYKELSVLRLTQKPNIEIIRTLLRISYSNLEDLKKANNYINLVDLAEYSRNQRNISIISYLDYIENLEKIGVPLTKKRLLPDDFTVAHEMSMEKVKIVENKILNQKIKQRYKQLEKNKYKNDKFIIRPAKTLNDIKDEAKQQHNCVYTNYSEKYAYGKTEIYFLRKLKKPEESLVTVEVLNGKIRQKYQKRNTATNKDQNNFLKLWEKNILNAA